MVDEQRIKNIASALSFAPLPLEAADWWHEPSLRLLTEDEAERLAPILKELGQHSGRGAPIYFELARMTACQLDLFETFIEKSEQGMKRLRDEGHLSVLQMNRVTPPIIKAEH